MRIYKTLNPEESGFEITEGRVLWLVNDLDEEYENLYYKHNYFVYYPDIKTLKYIDKDSKPLNKNNAIYILIPKLKITLSSYSWHTLGSELKEQLPDIEIQGFKQTGFIFEHERKTLITCLKDILDFVKLFLESSSKETENNELGFDKLSSEEIENIEQNVQTILDMKNKYVEVSEEHIVKDTNKDKGNYFENIEITFKDVIYPLTLFYNSDKGLKILKAGSKLPPNHVLTKKQLNIRNSIKGMIGGEFMLNSLGNVNQDILLESPTHLPRLFNGESELPAS